MLGTAIICTLGVVAAIVSVVGTIAHEVWYSKLDGRTRHYMVKVSR